MQIAAVASMLITSANVAAEATLLQGHVEHATATATTSAYSTSVQTRDNSQESFPAAYEGSWHCVTTVTDSDVSQVAPGTVTECDIEFKRAQDGRILAHWSQPGWTEAQSSITAFSANEAQLDRTAYFWADGAGGAWAARSRDQFSLTASSLIVSNSYIDQYVDGQYLGRYRTNSVLHRAGSTTTAMLPQQ
jgi:hypothetical protein